MSGISKLNYAPEFAGASVTFEKLSDTFVKLEPLLVCICNCFCLLFRFCICISFLVLNHFFRIYYSCTLCATALHRWTLKWLKSDTFSHVCPSRYFFKKECPCVLYLQMIVTEFIVQVWAYKRNVTNLYSRFNFDKLLVQMYYFNCHKIRTDKNIFYTNR